MKFMVCVSGDRDEFQYLPEVTASLEVNSDKDTVMANLMKMIQRYKR